MANKAFVNFKKKDTPPPPAEEKQEVVTWGAAWMGELANSDLPYLSVRISKMDFEKIVEYAGDMGPGDSVRFMMFPNRNPREGHKDPDYYIFPPKDEPR